MRVLTFTSLFPNAIDPEHGIFVYQRTAHLASRCGNSVDVVAPVPYFPHWLPTSRWRTASALPRSERVGDLPVYHPRYFLLPKISMPLHGLSIYWGALPLARQLHAKAKFDVIDAHFVYPDGFAAVLLGKSLNVPVMVTARGTDINVYPSFRTIRPMIRWTLRHAAIRAAVSTALCDQMAEVAGAALPIQVLPNGVDARRFYPVASNEAKRVLQIDPGRRAIVAVGSLIESKGHQLLIRAMAQLSKHYPDADLFILGHGPYLKTLQSLVQSLGLGERVHLVGKRPHEELKYWFSMADLTCLASAREGWPNVITESLACGTPVIATKVGGIPEIIETPELGILVERSPEAIAEGLQQGLTRKWNRENISKHALARSWDAVAEEIQALFVDAVARKPAPQVQGIR